MSKKTLVIVGVLVFVIAIVGGVTFLILNGNGGEPSQDSEANRPRSSSSAAILPVFIAPWVAIMAAINSPTAPLTNTWYYCVKRHGEKRAKAIDAYLSRRFKESSKYQVLLSIEPIGINKVTQPDKSRPGEIIFTLKDGKEYTCTTVKRDKAVDGSGTGEWVLDDICGNEFGT